MSVPDVRVVRVEGKPQRHAAYLLSDGSLVGYCGRNGIITHPEAGYTKGMRTHVVHRDDFRGPRKGLRRSIRHIKEMFDVVPGSTPKEKWTETGRKQLGLYASGKVSGPGWGNEGYINIVYEVSEIRTIGTKEEPETEFRTRIENGDPCRMRGEGYDAFVSLYKWYAAYARQHDAGAHIQRNLECVHRQENPLLTALRAKAADTDPSLYKKKRAASVAIRKRSKKR